MPPPKKHDMTEQKYPLRIIIRYSLIQLPGLAVIVGLMILIQRWVSIPLWIFLGILFLWIAKDVILFFFTWRSYDLEQRDIIIGMTGTVLKDVNPKGRVMVYGEHWIAESTEKDKPIYKGQQVEIIDRKGLVLTVKSVYEDNTQKR